MIPKKALEIFDHTLAGTEDQYRLAFYAQFVMCVSLVAQQMYLTERLWLSKRILSRRSHELFLVTLKHADILGGHKDSLPQLVNDIKSWENPLCAWKSGKFGALPSFAIYYGWIYLYESPLSLRKYLIWKKTTLFNSERDLCVIKSTASVSNIIFFLSRDRYVSWRILLRHIKYEVIWGNLIQSFNARKACWWDGNHFHSYFAHEFTCISTWKDF